MSSGGLDHKISDCVDRLLTQGSTVQNILQNLIREVLEQFVGGSCKIQTASRENLNFKNGKKRKISEYVTFCRYMKHKFPSQKNLQAIWRSSQLRNQWKSSMNINNTTIMETVSVVPSPTFKFKFDQVLDELKQMQEDDPIDTLFNIKRKAFFMKPNMCLKTVSLESRYSSSED